MTKSGNFAKWLRANLAPGLQDLVARHGGYNRITPEAWVEYDRALAEWEERRKLRHLGATAVAPDPETLCLCGLAGVYMRPRRGGGPAIWRCEQHRTSWPDYAEDVPWKRAAE